MLQVTVVNTRPPVVGCGLHRNADVVTGIVDVIECSCTRQAFHVCHKHFIDLAFAIKSADDGGPAPVSWRGVTCLNHPVVGLPSVEVVRDGIAAKVVDSTGIVVGIARVERSEVVAHLLKVLEIRGAVGKISALPIVIGGG